MTEWVWKSWGARKRSIEADMIRFEPHHVVFFLDRQMILAIKVEDCIDLHPAAEGDPAWW